MEKKPKKEIKRANYKLIADFKQQKKHYKAGETIALSEKGAAYLRTLKKIK
jgi:hypothetical protein